MKTIALILATCMFLSVTAQRIKNLIPDYGKIQYAGSIGFLSAGLGYSFLHDKINTELLYGYIPPTYGGPLDILTLRLICNPVKINITQSVSITPVTISGFISYHTGDQFYIFLPSKYYKDYYYWSSAIRYHIGAGSMLAYKNRYNGHGFALYYEVNTNDLYIKSLRANSTLKFEDILSLGVGIKFY